MHTVTYNDSQYVVAHNNNDVVHYAILEPGQEFSTGQPYLRQPDSEEELEKDVDELTGIPNYYKANEYGELYLLADVNERYMKPVFDHKDGHEIEDAPFDISTHHLYRYDKNIQAWVEGGIEDNGEWQPLIIN